MHGWDHYGVANMFDVTMGANTDGKITAANWQSYGQVQSNIDETKREVGIVTWPAVPGAGGVPPMDGGSASTPYVSGFRRMMMRIHPDAPDSGNSAPETSHRGIRNKFTIA